MYILYTSSLENPQTFTHDSFIVTSDFDNALCGDFTYDVTFDGSPITDSSVPPIAYDPSNRQFSVYSEDLNLLGLKTITVTGYYVLHSSNVWAISFDLEFVSPCT